MPQWTCMGRWGRGTAPAAAPASADAPAGPRADARLELSSRLRSPLCRADLGTAFATLASSAATGGSTIVTPLPT